MEVDEIVLPPNENEEESKLGCDMGKELSPSPEIKNKTLENITQPNQEQNLPCESPVPLPVQKSEQEVSKQEKSSKSFRNTNRILMTRQPNNQEEEAESPIPFALSSQVYQDEAEENDQISKLAVKKCETVEEVKKGLEEQRKEEAELEMELSDQNEEEGEEADCKEETVALVKDPFKGCPPRPNPPFLPPKHSCTMDYTLVLDLDETLIHYDDVSI